MLAARLPGDVGAALLEATLAPSEFLSCQARSASASCGESAMRVAAATARAGWASRRRSRDWFHPNNVEGDSTRGYNPAEDLLSLN